MVSGYATAADTADAAAAADPFADADWFSIALDSDLGGGL
jgi:hypothetical protein